MAAERSPVVGDFLVNTFVIVNIAKTGFTGDILNLVGCKFLMYLPPGNYDPHTVNILKDWLISTVAVWSLN